MSRSGYYYALGGFPNEHPSCYYCSHRAGIHFGRCGDVSLNRYLCVEHAAMHFNDDGLLDLIGLVTQSVSVATENG